MFETPILFIFFNRIETTKIVFSKIKQIKPKYLFLAADGPRQQKINENYKCDEVRKFVIDSIDWDCDVKTLFLERNLGCGRAVSGAITWFFENVEMGIILEDDIDPSLSFFRFCEELLVKYKHDYQIGSITAVNLIENSMKLKTSYCFSNYGGIWGWASWRRVWEGYDFGIHSWERKEIKHKINEKFSNKQFRFFSSIFNSVKDTDTWDYQWWFHKINKGTIDIIPDVCLTQNIGFNESATHTFSIADEIRELTSHEINFPLVHPKKVVLNNAFDFIISSKYYSINRPRKQILKRIFYRLRRMLNVH